MHRLARTSPYGLVLMAALAACGNDKKTAASSLEPTFRNCSAAVGGPVAGPADDHCMGVTPVTVDPNTCMTAPKVPLPSMRMADGTSEFGVTMNNADGADDDCKYKVGFTATPICVGSGVHFTVTVTALVDGSPVRDAAPRPEIFLEPDHPAPDTDLQVSEMSPGVYDVGPVTFDAPGQWTVRFHLFETCNDGPTSPHGHAAFYITVP